MRAALSCGLPSQPALASPLRGLLQGSLAARGPQCADSRGMCIHIQAFMIMHCLARDGATWTNKASALSFSRAHGACIPARRCSRNVRPAGLYA